MSASAPWWPRNGISTPRRSAGHRLWDVCHLLCWRSRADRGAQYGRCAPGLRAGAGAVTAAPEHERALATGAARAATQRAPARTGQSTHRAGPVRHARAWQPFHRAPARERGRVLAHGPQRLTRHRSGNTRSSPGAGDTGEHGIVLSGGGRRVAAATVKTRSGARYDGWPCPSRS